MHFEMGVRGDPRNTLMHETIVKIPRCKQAGRLFLMSALLVVSAAGAMAQNNNPPINVQPSPAPPRSSFNLPDAGLPAPDKFSPGLDRRTGGADLLGERDIAQLALIDSALPIEDQVLIALEQIEDAAADDLENLLEEMAASRDEREALREKARQAHKQAQELWHKRQQEVREQREAAREAARTRRQLALVERQERREKLREQRRQMREQAHERRLQQREARKSQRERAREAREARAEQRAEQRERRRQAYEERRRRSHLAAGMTGAIVDQYLSATGPQGARLRVMLEQLDEQIAKLAPPPPKTRDEQGAAKNFDTLKRHVAELKQAWEKYDAPAEGSAPTRCADCK